MATKRISTMATPTAAPMTRLRQRSREAASARKSSSPLGGIVPASVDGVVQKNTLWQYEKGNYVFLFPVYKNESQQQSCLRKVKSNGDKNNG